MSNAPQVWSSLQESLHTRNHFAKRIRQDVRRQAAEAGRELEMVMGNMKPWTLYRAKHKVLTPTLEQYEEDFKKLDQWMAEFCTINGESHISENLTWKTTCLKGSFYRIVK